LKNFERHYECRDQMLRKIDPNPDATRRNLLLRAYLRTERPDGLVSLGELGKALRELARDYEEQFGGKKLSEWIQVYPDTFKIHENYVVHRNYW
ncbi:MAG: OST-HTH/LOTUS domain-containing protein, partial [Anaerolineae bacterium]|nr:OST-HTH/LOTUS domain-containing protein [Anaerolineae bacterium]